MLSLSQPLGVGFSYAEKAPGSYSKYDDSFLNASQAPPDGRWPVGNNTEVDTTDLAAMAAWEVLQAFYSGLPQLSSNVTSREFNLATESYGGHYGPSFFNYFYEQSKLIRNGTTNGTALDMNSLLIINGDISDAIQVPHYPEFAMNNTYNITAYNQSVYDYTQLSLYGPVWGCLAIISYCDLDDPTTLFGNALCVEAYNRCRDGVEAAYYDFSDRSPYDIRAFANVSDISPNFQAYLNQAFVQEALGVDLNYTDMAEDVYYAFEDTGDFVYKNFLQDLEEILDNGVRVSLVYGDADYISNWFGGQAVSLLVNYTYTEQFNAAGYAPMVVDGVEYGETREYGNFSFTRVYNSGHLVPLYQPIAALQLFNRTINGFDSATGTEKVTADLSTNGTAQAIHIESSVALPTTAASPASGTAMARSLPRARWMRGSL